MIGKLIQKVEDFEVAQDQLNSSLSCKEAELIDASSKLAECMELLKIKNTELENEIIEKVGSVERVKALEKELVEVKGELDVREKELVEVKGKLDVREKELVEVKRELDVREKELVEVKGELDVREKELVEVKGELDVREKELVEVKGELDVRENEKVEAQQVAKESINEAETTIHQLHQVEEDLEYYFLLSQNQSELLDSSIALQQKASVLLASAHKESQNRD